MGFIQIYPQLYSTTTFALFFNAEIRVWGSPHFPLTPYIIIKPTDLRSNVVLHSTGRSDTGFGCLFLLRNLRSFKGLNRSTAPYYGDMTWETSGCSCASVLEDL